MGRPYGIADILVYNEVEDPASQDRDPKEVILNILKHDKTNVKILLDAEYKFGGISCGCHAKKTEMCIFVFAKGWQDMYELEISDMKVVPKD